MDDDDDVIDMRLRHMKGPQAANRSGKTIKLKSKKIELFRADRLSNAYYRQVRTDQQSNLVGVWMWNQHSLQRQPEKAPVVHNIFYIKIRWNWFE